jgi:hypothetical protein
MRNYWRVIFVNLPKKQGWGGEMANCWSCSKCYGFIVSNGHTHSFLNVGGWSICIP